MSSELSSDAVIFIDGKVSPAILASILGINVSLVYQEAQKGRLPTTVTESTYRECIQMYLNYFKKSQDLKIERLKEDTKLKEEKLKLDQEFKKRKATPTFGGDVDGDTIHPLVAMKMKQDVRLGRAKEEQLLQKTAIERGEYVATDLMAEMVEPLVISLRGSLLALADISAEHEKLVDAVMQDIYNLGVKLAEEATADAKEFVAEMMEREIDFND